MQQRRLVGAEEEGAARGEEEAAEEEKKEGKGKKVGSSGRDVRFFKFLLKGQNGSFTKLLGAPAILLGAPNMSLIQISSDLPIR